MGMRKEHEVPNGTLLVCRGDAICSGCAYEKRIAELESDRSRAWETAHKAVERGMGLEATLAALKSISLNSVLSWQDKHIAAFKILNPELLQEKG